jgi:hypothetical protein
MPAKQKLTRLKYKEILDSVDAMQPLFDNIKPLIQETRTREFRQSTVQEKEELINRAMGLFELIDEQYQKIKKVADNYDLDFPDSGYAQTPSGRERKKNLGDQLSFASSQDALQHLSDITGKRIKVSYEGSEPQPPNTTDMKAHIEYAVKHTMWKDGVSREEAEEIVSNELLGKSNK